jgi:hypothetical protein
MRKHTNCAVCWRLAHETRRGLSFRHRIFHKLWQLLYFTPLSTAIMQSTLPRSGSVIRPTDTILNHPVLPLPNSVSTPVDPLDSKSHMLDPHIV